MAGLRSSLETPDPMRSYLVGLFALPGNCCPTPDGNQESQALSSPGLVLPLMCS